VATQKEVKSRINSVKNVHKITRAMEMVAAARLRRAEQRIDHMRPYAQAIRKMTQQVADAAGDIPRVELLTEREQTRRVGVLLVTGDRGLAGAFNAQIIREGTRLKREYRDEGAEVVFSAVGRRGNSTLNFRGEDVAHAYVGFTDRPAFTDAREISRELTAAYIDEEVDRVDLVYNRYISPLTQQVTRETLLPLQHATILQEGGDDEGGLGERAGGESDDRSGGEEKRALVEYEPDPGEILERLIPAYVEISIYRALLESTASEHGARMTAMRNASENAGDIISDLTLQFNRERQAAITQEIMEVVAGAESLV
jgi:F-type H+-transporting ATPase subunit gamma